MPLPNADIVIIGSINMDLVCKVPVMPKPGETILGKEFVAIPGGKGANQAVAIARLVRNHRVHLFGRVGDDEYGRTLINGLATNGVQTSHVTITPGVSSGVAMILIDAEGENCIVVAPGANHCLTPADIDRGIDLIARAAVVIMQLEIPLETVEYVIRKCRQLGVKVILDPAPVPPKGLPNALFDVDILTPNESEAQRILDGKNIADVKEICMALLACGPRTVVLKLGKDGAMIVNSDGACEIVPPFKVKAVDTTAAGDALTGAMAVGLAEGMLLAQAVRFGNAAGALCCTTFGAQPSLPKRDEVEKMTRNSQEK